MKRGENRIEDDDGDNLSVASSKSVGGATTTQNSVERDEVREIKQWSSRDTRRIRLWRFLVTMSIVATAAAVTATTYILLKQEETDDFETAVSTFGHCVKQVYCLSFADLTSFSFSTCQ